MNSRSYLTRYPRRTFVPLVDEVYALAYNNHKEMGATYLVVGAICSVLGTTMSNRIRFELYKDSGPELFAEMISTYNDIIRWSSHDLYVLDACSIRGYGLNVPESWRVRARTLKNNKTIHVWRGRYVFRMSSSLRAKRANHAKRHSRLLRIDRVQDPCGKTARRRYTAGVSGISRPSVYTSLYADSLSTAPLVDC